MIIHLVRALDAFFSTVFVVWDPLQTPPTARTTQPGH